MVGVANPMLQFQSSRATRFLVGLSVGMVLASLTVAFAGWLVGTSVARALSHQSRLLTLAAICLVLGVADLSNRTPQTWRQVPQRLVRHLSPGKLALVWGFDLGLLFTTQKVVSLLWVAVAAVVLVAPQQGAFILGAAALVSSMTIAAATFANWRGVDNMASVQSRLRTRQLRSASGLALIAIATVVAWQAF